MSHIAFVVKKSKRKTPIDNKLDFLEQLHTPSYISLVANAFLSRGHKVDIYNNTETEIQHQGLNFKPINPDSEKNKADLIIMHNGAQELPLFSFKKAAIWQHNGTSLAKAWKRRELFSLWRFRPDVICLSNEALNKTPAWMPYKNRHLIPHAIEDSYFAAANSSLAGRKLRAYFASRPSRNLDFVIRAWEKFVHPQLPQAEFVICCPESKKAFPFDIEKLKKSNIKYVGNLEKSELIELAKSSRLLCYPGHINETGCRVALDAIGLKIPIITCGIGSLKDLVSNKKSGFIEKNETMFAKRIIECMTNDDLWRKLSQASGSHPWRQPYHKSIIQWEKAFNLSPQDTIQEKGFYSSPSIPYRL